MRKRRSTIPGRVEIVYPNGPPSPEEIADILIEFLGPVQTWDWMSKECFTPGEAPRPRAADPPGRRSARGETVGRAVKVGELLE